MAAHRPPADPPPVPYEEWNGGPPPGALDRALFLVRFLRVHCPWDRAQTERTLVPHLLEEAYETAEAVRADDPEALEGELGDLLLNLAFQVVLGEERDRFTRHSVTERLEEKMKRRHPHLFGLGPQEDWEALKARERPEGEGALAGLAPGLDPLLAAYRMQDRAAGVGFDWPDVEGPLAKVAEELEEVHAALERGEREGVEEEVGDLLFAVVNLARLAGVHPDAALDRANRKFRRRFERLEGLARREGVPLPGASLERLDRLWDALKADEGTDV